MDTHLDFHPSAHHNSALPYTGLLASLIGASGDPIRHPSSEHNPRKTDPINQRPSEYTVLDADREERGGEYGGERSQRGVHHLCEGINRGELFVGGMVDEKHVDGTYKNGHIATLVERQGMIRLMKEK